VLTGGVGNDTYVVGTGDSVVENANEGTDLVQSSVTWTLGANVENLTLTGSTAINGTGNTLDNILTGNTGVNVLTGGAGNDTYVVGTGDSVVENANEGTDTVQSSITYTLGSNVENLILTGIAAINGTGNTLNNVLTGNSAANVLSGGTGADIMAGGLGNDTYVIDNTSDVVTENASEGTDIVQSSVSYILAANLENLTLTGTTAINGTGNTLNNILTGNSANNSLTGNAGDDTLNGGTGSDTHVGGTGNDTYVVDNADGDVVFENVGEGTDTVQSSVEWALGANIENLMLTGTSAINGTGNTLNNTLTGNSANNTLTGGAGNDTYIYNSGGGQDTIVDNDATAGNSDRLTFGAGVNPINLVLSQQTNNLRLAIHGSSDQASVQNWYTGSANQVETIQAGNGQVLLNTQVDQLIQAMANYSTQSGLTWDQAIDQQPQDVQTILAAYWN
jgi:Ca2+-binding RTX toxin-like protein